MFCADFSCYPVVLTQWVMVEVNGAGGSLLGGS